PRSRLCSRRSIPRPRKWRSSRASLCATRPDRAACNGPRLPTRALVSPQACYAVPPPPSEPPPPDVPPNGEHEGGVYDGAGGAAGFGAGLGAAFGFFAATFFAAFFATTRFFLRAGAAFFAFLFLVFDFDFFAFFAMIASRSGPLFDNATFT